MRAVDDGAPVEGKRRDTVEPRYDVVSEGTIVVAAAGDVVVVCRQGGGGGACGAAVVVFTLLLYDRLCELHDDFITHFYLTAKDAAALLAFRAYIRQSRQQGEDWVFGCGRAKKCGIAICCCCVMDKW